MANISAIKLPDGVTYDIVDRVSKDIFIAEYGVTTYDEIDDAFIDGKAIILKWQSAGYYRYFPCSVIDTSSSYKLTFLMGKSIAYDVEVKPLTPPLDWSYSSRNLQETLVSGTSIKTINNESLLGSGDIDTKEIVIFDYDIDNPTTPSHTAISNAVHSGKRCYVRVYSSSDVYEDETFLPLVSLSSEHYAFFAVTSTTGSYRALTCNVSVLSPATYTTGSLQQSLVSGTNIKTINGNSILGSGNLTVNSGTQVQIVRW